MKKVSLKKVIKDTLPVMAGYLVIGMGFGIVMHANGYGIVWAVAMSLFVYAGSMQYAALGLLTGGASLLTVALRFAPFVLFAGGKTPSWLRYFGEVLPYAVMAMLVVYCLRGVSFQTAAGFLPSLIACVLVVGSYVWKRNTLISIFAGTVTYMLLVQMVFV